MTINVKVINICIKYIIKSSLKLKKAPEAAHGLENVEMKNDGNKTDLNSSKMFGT